MTSTETSARRGEWYAWVMVPVAALAMLATLPGRTHGLGMVTERLLSDPAFDLDRVAYSQLNLWATLLGGLFCLPCGWLIDRLGLRWTLVFTVAALAGSVFWMTTLSGEQPLFLSILLTRGFGQSALSIISITMVGKWFRGRISVPMAVYSLLVSFGFANAMSFAERYKDLDWRVLWTQIGWCLVGFLILGGLFTRNPPRAEETGEGETDPAASGFTLPQAMMTPAFWLFSISISLIALIGSGTSLFNESVLVQQGFAKQAYYDLVKSTFLVSLCAQLPIGWLGRHVRLTWLQGFGLGLLGACLLWLPTIRSDSQLRLYAIGMGLSGTTTTVLFFTIWAQSFGRKHLGQIHACAQMLTVLASALGPRLFAESLARTGSYSLVFQVLAGAALVLAVVSLLIRLPSPDEAPVPEPSVAAPSLGDA